MDCDYSGGERRRWAGVGYESEGGKEVGKMVKGLWDERGWECLWVRHLLRLRWSRGEKNGLNSADK